MARRDKQSTPRAKILDSKTRTANLLQNATSPELKPGYLRSCWIGAGSANVILQTWHLVLLQLHQVGSLNLDLRNVLDGLIKLD